MEVRGVDFVLFLVRNLERSMQFYQDFLGLELAFYKEEWQWAEFNAGNVTLSLCGNVTPSQSPKANMTRRSPNYGVAMYLNGKRTNRRVTVSISSILLAIGWKYTSVIWPVE